MKEQEHVICKNCIMDSTDPYITFDKDGICNHCIRYQNEIHKRVFSGELGREKLNNLLENIKKSGKGKEYDCVIGVSGGVDSTYVAYLTKRLGLRPLAIHFDNGWNSEIAVSNIEKTLDKLQIDLYTYVIDWEEFRELQISFLNSSTPDGEIPTDHAINALLFKEASKRNIKYIINGMNFAAESISVPGWSYGHSDWKYIKSVHKLFRNTALVNYPHYTFYNLFWWMIIRRIKVVSILNYIDYNKEVVMGILKNELNWVYYGGKHYESVYTRFYQGYVLPEKFNIDKRKAHFSDLIKSGQMSRNKAIQDLEKPIYDDLMFKQDYKFVLKKLMIDQDEFDRILKLPKKSFRNYPNNFNKVIFLKKLLNSLREKNILSR